MIEDDILDAQFKLKAAKCDTLKKKILFCETFLAKHRPKANHSGTERFMPEEALIVSMETHPVFVTEYVPQYRLAQYNATELVQFEKQLAYNMAAALGEYLFKNDYVQLSIEDRIATDEKIYNVKARVAKVKDYGEILNTYPKK